MEAWFDFLRLDRSLFSNSSKDKGFKLVQKTKLDRLLKMAKESHKRKIYIPLETLAITYKLSTTEKALLMIFAHSMIYMEGHQRNLVETLAKSQITDFLSAFELIKSNSILVKKRIITHTPREGYKIDKKFIPKVLGVKVEKIPAFKPRAATIIPPNPAGLSQKLSKYVVGQEEAKKVISTSAFIHYKKITLNAKRQKEMKMPKSNILIIGPTGCGKTYLCKMLGNFLKAPVIKTDATQYTETGYVGKTVDDIIFSLYDKLSPSLASKAIIHIDEIDKIAGQNSSIGHNSQRDVSGKSVQEELLKLLEGDIVDLEHRELMGRSAKTFDISKNLFIVSGAFNGLDEIITERIKKRAIGFNIKKSDKEKKNILHQVTKEDLINYGFLPEFIGRFSAVAVMNPLTKEEMIEIISKTKNNIASQTKDILKASGIEADIPEDIIESIAEKAVNSGMGARAARELFEKWTINKIYADSQEPLKRKQMIDKIAS